MNEKIKALGKKCFRVIFVSHERKSAYCVYTINLGANLWLLLGARSMPFGCMSMARLGAKYAEVGCKSMDTFGCMYAAFGCLSMARLGACMRLLGACLTVGSFA